MDSPTGNTACQATILGSISSVKRARFLKSIVYGRGTVFRVLFILCFSLSVVINIPSPLDHTANTTCPTNPASVIPTSSRCETPESLFQAHKTILPPLPLAPASQRRRVRGLILVSVGAKSGTRKITPARRTCLVRVRVALFSITQDVTSVEVDH